MGRPRASASSSSRSTLQAVAVDTPLASSMGASSFRSAPTMWACATVRMASSSCRKLTPPASGVPVPGKYAQRGELDSACEKALAQIDGKGYISELREEGYHTVYKYGIACFRKRCRVSVKKEEL